MAKAVTLCALLLLAACSQGSDLDPGAVETAVENGLAEQMPDVGAGVACPDQIRAEKGKIVDCDAQLVSDGQTRAVSIRVTFDDDQGHFHWQVQDT